MSLVFPAAAVCLLGLLAPSPSLAGDQGWLPVVATTNKAVKLELKRPIPPLPPTRSTARVKTPPASNGGTVVPPLFAQPDAAAPAAGRDPIVTGSVDSIESTKDLSREDAARIEFAEAGDSPAEVGAIGAAEIQGSDLARGYCVNVANAAADARVALQRAKLAEVEKQITERIAALEARTAEFKSWVERRDEFLKRVTGKLVNIYTQMEPDAAALQLVAMDEETAAALLTKLDPQSSSAILNEMQPDKAARLTATIAGAARAASQQKRAAPAAAPPEAAAAGRTGQAEGRS